MFTIWREQKDIQYLNIASQLFSKAGDQEMVPFLGAGVSVSGRKDEEKEPKPNYPDDNTLDQVAALLKLDAKARLYLEYAVRTAVRMQAWNEANGEPLTAAELKKKLVESEYPPFVWELAEFFSLYSQYTSFHDRPYRAAEKRELLPKDRLDLYKDSLVPMFKLLSRTTDITSPTDPLTSISSYFENTSDRKNLWDHLYQIFENKKTPTQTHLLIAKIAERYFQRNVKQNYLIVTTNYDCLMENALDKSGLPYAVLWWSRGDKLVHARFANLQHDDLQVINERYQPLAPLNFTLPKTQPIVIVYKMHGCLNPELVETQDGVVITDADYVGFISDIDKIIPAQVGSMLPNKRILFLGYSFSDWNVRSIYETTIRRTAKRTRDYAVTKALSKFEEMYFNNREIIIALSDLDTFAKGLQDEGLAKLG